MRRPRAAVATGAACVAMALGAFATGCGGDTAGSATSTAPATSGAGTAGALLASAPAYSDDLKGFLAYVGDELNDFWEAKGDPEWRKARVLVPETSAETACGTIDTETGPAYCGADRTMVLPVAFFRSRLIGADDDGTNDAAVAGVVGHEFGHHLQSIYGLEETVDEIRAQQPEVANLFSVAYELHADCMMGVWMSSVDDEGRLETGDLDEVLGALDTIGDDKLTADAGQVADPATFDHGTSEQRQVWFGVGYSEADPAACNVIYDDLADGTLEKELQQGADAANAGAR